METKKEHRSLLEFIGSLKPEDAQAEMAAHYGNLSLSEKLIRMVQARQAEKEKAADQAA